MAAQGKLVGFLILWIKVEVTHMVLLPVAITSVWTTCTLGRTAYQFARRHCHAFYLKYGLDLKCLITRHLLSAIVAACVWIAVKLTPAIDCDAGGSAQNAIHFYTISKGESVLAQCKGGTLFAHHMDRYLKLELRVDGRAQSYTALWNFAS
jgi:hypothetical protein